MLLGNIIFHAFEAAYVTWRFLFPLAIVVLAIESAILRWFNRSTPLRIIVLCALGMNLVSYFAGNWLSPRLFVKSGLVVVNPDEHGYGILDRGPDWQRLSRLSFLQAAIVSMVIEIAALWPPRRWTGLRHVVIPVILGNCVSYALLALGFLAIFGKFSHV